jgi:hypothetical protein
MIPPWRYAYTVRLHRTDYLGESGLQERNDVIVPVIHEPVNELDHGLELVLGLERRVEEGAGVQLAKLQTQGKTDQNMSQVT